LRSQFKARPSIVKKNKQSREENTDYLISLSFADAKDAIHEQMMLANKQSVGHVARMTQALVEKLSRDMDALLLKFSTLSEKLNCQTPTEASDKKQCERTSVTRKQGCNIPTRYSNRARTSSHGLSFSELSQQINRFSQPDVKKKRKGRRVAAMAAM